MFEVNSIVVYGSNGIFKVIDVGPLHAKHLDSKRSYYTLKSIYTTETIYIPTNTTVYMRNIISQEKAMALLQKMPALEDTIFPDSNMHALKEYYESYLLTPDPEALIQLARSIYTKRQNAEEIGKKLGQIDQRYWKRAEDLLYGELAVALNVARDNVEEYVEKYIQLSHRS